MNGMIQINGNLNKDEDVIIGYQAERLPERLPLKIGEQARLRSGIVTLIPRLKFSE